MKIEFMQEAYKQALKAYKQDEVPIGCVIVKDDQIIAKAFNHKERKNLATAHAEIECINKASKKLNTWNLTGCDLYVTLEPCIMCAGAIINSRITNVYYSTYDYKGGAFGSNVDVTDVKKLNHYPKVKSGIMQEESANLLKEFFKNKR